MSAFTRTRVATTYSRTAVCAAMLLTGLTALSPGSARATDLHYFIQSPALGGGNPAALQMAQYDRSLELAKAAAAAAANKPPVDPNAAFVNAIISQLNGLVAQSIAQKIASSTNGQSGFLQSGSVSITYMNTDGQLTITITSPSGTTTLTVPTGS